MKIVLYTFAALLFSFPCLSQDIVWATKLVELTDVFQFENNGAQLVLGAATVYANKNLEDPIDATAEGYILNFNGNRKKNSIKVAFPQAVPARQLVIGGVFNIGCIVSVSVYNKAGQEKTVYKLEQKSSKSKFNTFTIFFPYDQIVGAKIVFDHTNINNWNLVKGIGVTNFDKPVVLKPTSIINSSEVKKEKIAGNITTKDCYEFGPKLSPDEKTLYFVKECPNGSKKDQDIWYAKLGENNQWSEAKVAEFPLNNDGHNFVASVSPNNNFLVFGNIYKSDGSNGGDGVAITHRKSDGSWEIPTTIKLPNYTNVSDHANFYLNKDENIMILALQDDKSVGELDLYVSVYDKNKKTWGDIINLGKSINTSSSEDYPYLANDGVTLYFSSKGYLGYGGHDIFVSKRLDETWKNWSIPLNLGSAINSKSDDKGFSITSSGKYAYYNSVNFDSDLHEMEINKINLPKQLYQQPQVFVRGVLFDTQKNVSVRGAIKIKTKKGEVVAESNSNPRNGIYEMSVPLGNEYDIQVNAIDYFQATESLNLTDTSASLNVVKNYNIMSYLDSNQYLLTKTTLFAPQSDKLSPSANIELDNIAEKLFQQSNMNIEIGVFPEIKSEASKKLALLRANAIGLYLINKGVRDKRLTYKNLTEKDMLAISQNEVSANTTPFVIFTCKTKLPKD